MDEGESTNEAGPGTIIGSYRLMHGLGSGGMSSVFKAVHIETGHEVALKLLPRALAKNQTLLQRFLREAKSAEALEHPNIVSIYDRGVDEGRNYLILELVEGGDLQERVRKSGPLPPAEAVRVIKTVAEGLRYAVGQGLIHRDIKPANLLLAPNGHVKIIDLGLALQPRTRTSGSPAMGRPSAPSITCLPSRRATAGRRANGATSIRSVVPCITSSRGPRHSRAAISRTNWDATSRQHAPTPGSSVPRSPPPWRDSSRG